jgi:adenylate cyclase
MKYAVIGDTVNTAARVEGLNKTLKTNILVTDSVFKQAQAVTEACASLKDMGAHQVKGKGDKVHVYAYRKEGQD